MLTLTRKVGERVVVADTIVFEIVSVRGNKVQVGIVAPRDLPIHREEVYEDINGVGATKRVMAEAR